MGRSSWNTNSLGLYNNIGAIDIFNIPAKNEASYQGGGAWGSVVGRLGSPSAWSGGGRRWGCPIVPDASARDRPALAGRGAADDACSPIVFFLSAATPVHSLYELIFGSRSFSGFHVASLLARVQAHDPERGRDLYGFTDRWFTGARDAGRTGARRGR